MAVKTSPINSTLFFSFIQFYSKLNYYPNGKKIRMATSISSEAEAQQNYKKNDNSRKYINYMNDRLTDGYSYLT